MNVDKRLEKLYELIENDLLGNLMFSPNYISPYKVGTPAPFMPLTPRLALSSAQSRSKCCKEELQVCVICTPGSRPPHNLHALLSAREPGSYPFRCQPDEIQTRLQGSSALKASAEGSPEARPASAHIIDLTNSPTPSPGSRSPGKRPRLAWT